MKEKLEKLLPFIGLTLIFGTFIILLSIDLHNHVNYWNDVDTFNNCSHVVYYAKVTSRDDLSDNFYYKGDYSYGYELVVYSDGNPEYCTIESDTFLSTQEYCILEVVYYVKPKYIPTNTIYKTYKTEYYLYDIGHIYLFDKYEFFDEEE